MVSWWSRFSQITQIWHFCTKLTLRDFKRFQQKIKLPPVGTEVTTDHHWFRSLINAYPTVLSRHVLNRRSFVQWTWVISRLKRACTRMHSSRMYTTHSSSCQLWGGVLPQCMLGYTPRCGPGDPPGQTPQALPWVWAWKPARHAGIHTALETCKACWDTSCKACWDTIPPLWTDRHM